MDVGGLVDRIDAELRAAGGPDRAADERAYLKSELEHYGASVTAVRAVIKGLRRDHPDLSHDDVISVLPRAGRASGVTVREAVKPLLEQQRAAVLAAR